MLSVGIGGDAAGELRPRRQAVVESVLQRAALAEVDRVPQHHTAELLLRLRKNILIGCAAAVVDENDGCKARRLQIVQQRRQALIRLQRGNEYRDDGFVRHVLSFSSCSVFL